MWDTLMDLFLLLAIGGWLMLWFLRERGHFGIRRGMATALRPTNPSSPRRPGNERILPDGDQTTRQSPKNPARRHGNKLSKRPNVPARRLGSSSHQPSATPSLTRASRSDP